MWVLAEAALWSKVIYSGELPRDSADTCRVAPFTFGRSIGSLVLILRVCAPTPIRCGIQLKNQHAVKEIFIPVY
jgi:hypothetical protein